MNLHNIDDYGLTADKISEKYEQKESHPAYTPTDWRHKVNQHSTLIGYWDWVVLQLQDEQDELDRDNPYCQHMSLGEDD